MSMKERIVCAAVRFTRENIRTGAESFVDILCINYQDDIFKDSRIKFCSGIYIALVKEDKGFITNKNRFVDPQEAMKIALGNDQVSEARSLWDIFKKAKNCKERNSIEEAINRRTKILLERGLLPEDLY